MTAQIPDVILYKGKHYSIACEPLESYLNAVQLPHKLVARSSACWRGYISKWAIDNNKLFLIWWQGYISKYQEVNLNYLFPGEEFVFADWFTGTIRIPMGKIVSYVHGGYESIYEGNIFLEFEKGVLIKEHSKWLTLEEIEEIIKADDEFPF